MPTASFAMPSEGTTASIAASPRARRAPIDRADLAACKAMLAEGSRTFLAASWLLPRAVRDPACALYAFCRVADDAIDRCPPGEVDAALASLRARLDAIYGDAPMAASPDRAADRALAAVVRHVGIPRVLPEALLEGFAWDAAGRRYESLDELHDYAARVAGTVGAMMALIMGVRAPAALARACELGLAMQLSNIARDVGEDARAGRLYLPTAWLREAGLDVEAWLQAPARDPHIEAAVRRLLGEADALYAGVEAGIACLPPSCRTGIDTARRLYAEIGREVARHGCDSVSRRAVVGMPRKVRLVVRAAMTRARPAPVGASPLPATRHLVEAAANAWVPADAALPASEPAAIKQPRRRASAGPGRVVWLIDLFDRIERHREMGAVAGVR